MDHSQKVRRFRANPVEVTIFSIVALVFVNSVYNLFYEHDGIHAKALVPMAANPLKESQRSVASATHSQLYSLELPCEKTFSKDLPGDRVRLLGTFCDKNFQPSKLVKTQIINTANHFAATIFTDAENGKFSTDYIPLEPGVNGVHLEFSLMDGKTFTQELALKRLAN